jgi:hypothetical protein
MDDRSPESIKKQTGYGHQRMMAHFQVGFTRGHVFWPV